MVDGIVSAPQPGAGSVTSVPLTITLGSESPLVTNVLLDETASAYTVNPVTLLATQGQPLENVQVATVAGPADGSYTATINWGDGDTSVGLITSLGGDLFSVNGDKPHPYAATGTDMITVTVTGPGTTPTTPAQSIAAVSAGVLPTVSGVSPESGPTAGETVVITGTGFAGATAVYFGGTAVTSFSINDTATQIIANAPAESAGTVNVTVVTPGGTSVILRPTSSTIWRLR